ncbi:hypothetical protein [Streptomyces sediminimaris]|uniref:hypothetical protein n=1 Tax=Streptomyces sediminimaris TaxID=3383721 RepID=UPI00399A9CC4
MSNRSMSLIASRRVSCTTCVWTSIVMPVRLCPMRFAEVWDDADRRAHTAVVKVLTGEGGSAVQAGDGRIDLHLGTVVDDVKQKPADAGFDQAALAVCSAPAHHVALMPRSSASGS